VTTYYWDSTPLASAELSAARDVLVKSSGGPEFTSAFLSLLRSGQRAPVSIALARFQYSESESRWGSDNPAQAVAAEVLDRARWLLRQPAMSARESGATADEADHASALLAIMNLAEPEDAGLIADVLDRSSEHEVLFAASYAAHRPLEQAQSPDPRLAEAIGRRALDRTLDPGTRADVLRALRYADCARGAELAVLLAESDEIELQIAAAEVLAAAHLATHRAVVVRLLASWPADTIGLGNVRMLLDDVD
jgi:hypothetical protein